MTWSILAHDPATGAFAVAVTTCNLAVGAAVPHLRAGVGAVATQSMTNRYLGPAILDAMQRGVAPALAIQGALAMDEGREIRQVHAIDIHGRTAAWTGGRCVEYCGHRTGQGWSVAGNMLANEAVVADTVAALIARPELPLPERMLAALDAGEAAGGDRRGRQSAALQLITTEDFNDIDLRVDDHQEPLAELRRLLGLWRAMREARLKEQPRRASPAGLIDLDVIEERFRAMGLPVKPR
ncbi:DUF1028 domain-containing protein [Rhodovarius lipocyclicus]|uniref:DUF1028 domain-containing protein n=1 Tax=Rhodovarius lipocyclicus TaxID=268410 RepID=UPI0013583CD5|nr:DUF1028 domain-containing protein [Rhodovarius lipocyclicus]